MVVFVVLLNLFLSNQDSVFTLDSHAYISATEIHANSHTEFWNGDVSAYNAGAMLRIADGAEHIASPAELFADSTLAWKGVSEINLLERRDSVYWAVLSVRNPKSDDFSGYFFFNAWKKIELFRIDTAGKLRYRKQTGNYLPISERDVANRRIPFIRDVFRSGEVQHYAVKLVRGGDEFWMDDSNERITCLIYAESEILETEATLRLILGLSVGIVFTLILFNLVMSLLLKNLAALYNGLFLLFFELFYITVYGIGLEYFWPNSVFFDFHAHSFFVVGCIVSISQFFRYSVDLPRRQPRLSVTFNAISIATIAIVVTQLTDQRGWNELFINLLFTCTFFLGVVVTYRAWKAGDSAAKYFFIGIAYMHVVQIFIALSQNGVLPYFYGAITNFDLAQYAGSVMVALYSYGLIRAFRQSTVDVVTEAQRRETAERDAEAARALEESKSNFFSAMSHEFRTPLTLIINAIHGFSKFSKEKQERAISSISLNSKRLLRLINHLLDLSKLEEKHMGLNTKKYDLIRFGAFTVNSFKSAAKSKGIGLKFSAEAKELFCDLDFPKLEQVLLNLLSNALKFTKEGEILVSVSQSEDKIKLTVSDTGIGIPTTKQSDIFKRFYQVDQGDTREYEGSGIGLSLSGDLIKLHGGELSLESTPNVGSTFLISLPYQNEPETDAWQPVKESFSQDLERAILVSEIDEEAAPHEGGTGQSILIVEDQKEMRMFLKTLLDDSYTIIEARNGKMGVELAERFIPDLILTDVMMPHMDGISLIHRLKENAETKHIPVMVISGKANVDERIEGISGGAVDYIIKPFDAKELKFKVHSLLQMYTAFKGHLTATVLNNTLSSSPNAEEKFLIDLTEKIRATMKDVTSSGLADAFAMSESSLFRRVKSLTGEGVNAFVRKVRLHEAEEKLRGTADSVEHIANFCGFKSVSHFSKLFKEEFSTTPNEFRKGASSV